MREVVAELGPQFERATGHRLTVTLDVANCLTKRIEAGEPSDVANIAVSLFSSPSLAEYERYRTAVKQDEVALAA